MQIFFLPLLLLFSLTLTIQAQVIDLTSQEKSYIQQNPIVKIGMMPDFTPFSYYIENTPVGFEHDLLKLISKKTGLQFKEHIAKWTDIYTAFQNKEVDIISSISYKKYRLPFTRFTSAYYEIPIMIFVKDDFGEYKGLKSLTGKKVGVLKDVFYIKELEKMGTMDLVIYDNYADLTKDLVFGKIDALMQNLTNINYLIKKNLYTNLQLASELVLPNTQKEDLRFGVNPDKPLLSSILQKALNSITQKEKETLVNKWIGNIKEYGGGHIELNKDETAYLDTHVIKYCINPDGMPFEGLNKKGHHIGMSSDYYTLFEKMTSAKFELVKTKNWNETIQAIQKKECNMMAFSMETPERKKYLHFTSEYINVPLVVATRVDVPFINHILDLEGEKIGIIKGDAFVKILRQKYPSLTLVEVEDITTGLNGVKNNELFAFIDTLASIGYEFQSNYFGELKIAGKINESLKLSMAINKEDTVLQGILQKAINAISNETHREIFNKWLPIRYQKNMNYDLVWKVTVASIIIIAFIIYWNTKIIKTNTLLRQAQKDIEEKNKALNKLAITDKLTTLYNRRKLEELLQTELLRSERFNHPFALSIIDIDNFKAVNDTFGHQVGDQVLIQIAHLLKSSLRKTDFVGRYGGEEFIIICPETTLEDAQQLMENIRQKIEQHHFETIKNKTASFGVTRSHQKDTMDSIINRADKALYDAKNSGRNKVVAKI